MKSHFIDSISWTWNVLSTWTTLLLEYNYPEIQITFQLLLLGVVASSSPLKQRVLFRKKKTVNRNSFSHKFIGLTRRQWIKPWRMRLHSQEVFPPRKKGSHYAALSFYLRSLSLQETCSLWFSLQLPNHFVGKVYFWLWTWRLLIWC